MKKTKKVFHLVKRSDMSRGKALVFRLIAVLLSLIVCAIVLLLIAVGLTPAFRMKFWNLGAEGQILIGGAASAAVMIYFAPSLPPVLTMIILLAASMIAGMLWGFLPAFFKAKFNTNETLFTLMMNYVAMQIVTFCVVLWEHPAGSNSVGVINQSTRAGWFPRIGGLEYLMNVIIVVLVTVLTELSVVGESHNTARYAGIDVKKVIIRTMMISSAICGLSGAVIVSGASHTISTSTAGGRGFTAVVVAWLAQFNPFAMIATSALLVFMQQGSIQIASQYGLNENASDIITGIILFFLVGCEFFIRYRIEGTEVEIEEKAGGAKA